MIRTAFPTAPNFAVRFGRYTLQDLLRIGSPALIGWFVGGLTGLIFGGLVGLVLAEIEIEEKHLDEHVTAAIREWFLELYGQELTINTVWKDAGVAAVSNDTLVGTVRVESVDLRNTGQGTQQANRDTVLDLFNEIDYPIEIHSIQRLEDLSQYSGFDGDGVTTDHYIVIKEFPRDTGFFTADPEDANISDRIAEVQDRCRTIRDALSGGDMSATWLTGDEFKSVIQRFASKDSSQPIQPGLRDGNHTDGRQIAAVTQFPPKPPIQWLGDVLNTQPDGLLDVVQVIEPISEDQRSRLDRMMGRLQAEIFGEARHSRKTRLQRIYEDYQDLQAAEVEGERLVNYGVYIAANGSDQQEAATTMAEAERVLRRFQADTWTPTLHTRSAEHTLSPLHHDRLNKTQIVPARSAASGFPFAAYDTIESGGVVFGTDTRSGLPLVLDRFSWDAGHIARMGKIGSGKSFAAKLELLRSNQRYDNLQVLIVDPKQEYRSISRSLNHLAQRWQPSDRTADNTEFLVDSLRKAYRLGHLHDGKTIVIVDETHRLLNHKEGRTVLGELIREGRDQDIAVTLVTQNAADFTQSQEGRNILRNVDCYVFMRHQEVDNDVDEFFGLSQTESVHLRKLRTGTHVDFSEAVIRGPANTTLRIHATSQEASIIAGEPQDTASEEEEAESNSEERSDSSDIIELMEDA